MESCFENCWELKKGSVIMMLVLVEGAAINLPHIACFVGYGVAEKSIISKRPQNRIATSNSSPVPCQSTKFTKSLKHHILKNIVFRIRLDENMNEWKIT